MLVIQLGGLALLGFLPVLLAGAVLSGRVGVTSQTDGAVALARIAAAGRTFPVMNALFHLGALLMLPVGAALVVALRGPGADPWLLLGGMSLMLTVATAAGLVFALNQGLYRLSPAAATAPDETRIQHAIAGDMNLRTQAGAELVQSLGIAGWLLATAIAMQASGWDAWIVWLGVAGGIGFTAAGMSSVLMAPPLLGQIARAHRRTGSGALRPLGSARRVAPTDVLRKYGLRRFGPSGPGSDRVDRRPGRRACGTRR